MDWDELNLIRSEAERFVNSRPTKKQIERFCDYLDFVLCLIYRYGWKDAEEIIGIAVEMGDLDDKAVNREVAGETFRERVESLFTGGNPTAPDLLRIIDTEAHRDYNTGVFDAAVTSGVEGLKKRWNTRMDDRVRDPHAYMEGMTVGLNDEFYTYTGDSTLYPGGFGVPELDCNCRCSISLER